jgi:hypothetical protein
MMRCADLEPVLSNGVTKPSVSPSPAGAQGTPRIQGVGFFSPSAIGPGESMSISRNALFLIIGALIVTAGVLGYNLYLAKKQPDGVQINVGPNGLKIQGK